MKEQTKEIKCFPIKHCGTWHYFYRAIEYSCAKYRCSGGTETANPAAGIVVPKQGYRT